jgi:hypothetical protein
MARQALTIAGAVVGTMFGAPQLGFMIGSLVGNAVDPVTIQGPKIGDLAVQTSRDGVPRPIVFGTAAVTGNIIDRSAPKIVKKKERSGKGGPVTVTERVYMSYAIRVCEGPATSISRVWENEKLVYDATPGSTIVKDSTKFLQKVTFYMGEESQLPDPTLEAIHGVGSTPAHRGTCYAVWKDKDLTDFGGAIPQYRFEVNGPVIYQDSYLLGSDSSGFDALLTYQIDGSDIVFVDSVSGTNTSDKINNLGDGYITWEDKLYRVISGEIIYQYAVPYGGVGVDRSGANVRKLVVSSTTTTHFNMTRTTYTLAGAVVNTETFSIAKLDGDNNSQLRLFANSAQYTQQRLPGAGSSNVSAWFDDDTQLVRPIQPPIGTDTYYSAWATSTASDGHAVISGGFVYTLGGNVRTWFAKWPIGDDVPVAYYELSASVDVPAYHCADEQGNIWLVIPSQTKTIKFDPDLNIITEFPEIISTSFGSIAAVIT